MTNKKNIVCVSNTTWEGFYTKSTVQLVSLLAKSNQLLFVEYPFTIKDLIFTLMGKGRAPVKRMLGIKSRLVKKQSTFDTEVNHLVLPPLLPFAFFKNERLYNFFLNVNTFFYARSIKRAIKKLNMTDPIALNAYNAIYGNTLLGKLKESLSVYYCYDGPDERRYGKRAQVADHSYAEKVDGVITTSDFLADSMKHLNDKMKVVKNGVDFNVFNKSAKTNINTSNKKKVGYIGSLDHRFDIETVEYTVQQLSDYEFEIVGDLMNPKIHDALAKYPNVTFLPPVKPHEVPDLLKKCDVGLIPYLCTEYTKNIYPLKINEYLSVGVPVVLTSFANLPEFDGVANFTKNKEDFCEAIRKEIEQDNVEKILSRIEYAKATSWESRAKDFEKVLDDYLAQS
ncbi:glycosyltransferase [Marinifilum caeruleilacunae]|uniref:Glycosyltransferase n=1 Tax=Marinifilum caeruleilacunae TaxID=2499076 RepID=A0ABX1WV35_9BACT|nr:glycosyltransferase [Marinifilum caeruleilacunae]NOU59985.1 glycosyltransferase [Marinifilum caeruleilacunae]